MINIYIIDDHPLYIEGVVKAIDTDDTDVTVVGTAISFNELQERLKSYTIDVILLDLKMPEVDGVQCFLYIRKHFPDIKVIAVTGELDSTLLLNAWLSGIDAIISKWSGKEELLNAIHQVRSNQRFIDNSLPNIFQAVNVARDERAPKLTPREEEVLKLLATGITRMKVAQQFNISLDSVNFHCKNIFKKFNKNKLNEVLIEAKKYKIIP